jgi:hypothetical protein
MTSIWARIWSYKKVNWIAETISYGSYQAVIAEISESAPIAGRNEWLIDLEAPFAMAFSCTEESRGKIRGAE